MAHMKARAKPAWDRLAEALESTVPDCHEDDRYIADTLSRDDREDMLSICLSCPLYDLCAAYERQQREKAQNDQHAIQDA